MLANSNQTAIAKSRITEKFVVCLDVLRASKRVSRGQSHRGIGAFANMRGWGGRVAREWFVESFEVEREAHCILGLWCEGRGFV